MRGLEQIPWLFDLFMWLGDRLGGLSRWRNWLTGGARGRVLEVGCGTGRNLPRYARPPVAIEPHRGPLRRARRRAPGAFLVQARAEALPFADGSFDTVVSSLVLCSVEDPPRSLLEVKRVLAPGGEVRFLEHVRLSGWRGRVQDAIQPLWTRVMGGCHPNRRTEEAVEAAGLQVEAEGRRAKGSMRRFAARAR